MSLTRSFTETDGKLEKIWEEGKANDVGGQTIGHQIYDVGYKDGENDSFAAGALLGAAGALGGVVLLAYAIEFKNFVKRKFYEHKRRKNAT